MAQAPQRVHRILKQLSPRPLGEGSSIAGGHRASTVVAVVGGGNSAHVIAGLLGSLDRFQVRLLVQPNEVKFFGDRMIVHFQQNDQVKQRWAGAISMVSDKARQIIPDADIIILCLPVMHYRRVLHRIGPHVSKSRQVFVGAIYGQGGFNWMIKECTTKHALPNVIGFTVGLIPWICRAQDYGKIGLVYGCKAVNCVAMTHAQHFRRLDNDFLSFLCERPFGGQGAFELCSNFLSLTLSVDNQIIHPSRCYGLYQQCEGRWASAAEVPFFYRDFDDLSTTVLRGLDDDYSTIRRALQARYPSMHFHPMLDYLGLERYSLGTANTDIRASFVHSVQLRDIKPPLARDEGGGVCLDTQHRFFHDDINFGLCIAKWFATQLHVAVPSIDCILQWAQKLKKERLVDGEKLLLESPDITGQFRSGVPSVYGFHSLDEVLG